jgi:diguanylate cyclase
LGGGCPGSWTIMGVVSPSTYLSELEQVGRPLMRLVQHLTGMETSFITAIDWESQHQDVLVSLNTGAMVIAEGERIDWADSMCRSMFLSGDVQSCDVGITVPATTGAIALGMTSFFALPLLVDDRPIGTVCGASRRAVVLNDDQLASMQLIADAVQELLHSEVSRRQAIQRADLAERDAVDARGQSEHHAQVARHMELLAHTDELTGLPNRRAFTSSWEDALATSARRHYPIGVLLIDVDRFKMVNDTQGHGQGDAVLVALGACLKANARCEKLAARLGGDEFALAVTDCNDKELLALAETIQHSFALDVIGLGVDATLSIGIASSDTCSRHQLMATADKALYESKNAGGDCARLANAQLCAAD